MGLKDILLSARVTGIVMNYPLYDGHVSKNARRLIADGRLDKALDEYRRLAELGSGLARCVLAYLSLRDLPGAPRSAHVAKALANAALSREPGYANYVLAYAASYEKDSAKSVELMYESYKAHFIPAASAIGLIFGQGYGVSKDPKKAEAFFLRAISLGHIPAPMLLCRFYMQGQRGVVKASLGLLLLPISFLYMWVCTRFLIFSIHSFRHFNLAVPPMFNEKPLKSW
jgi:TPR repeat protein